MKRSFDRVARPSVGSTAGARIGRRARSVVRVVLLGALASAGLTQAAADEDATAYLVPVSAAQRRALGIEVDGVVPATATTGLSQPARVTVPNDQVRVVAAAQAGLVETLLVAVGDVVELDQPMARIHSPELIASQRELLQAIARLELARAAAERDAQLVEEGIVPGRRALESRTARAERAARVDELRRALELAGMTAPEIATLEREGHLQPTLVVRAPIGGAVVLEQMAEAGRRVEVADPLYRLGQLSPLWLEVHVPLAVADGVSPGDEVLVPEADVVGRVVAVGRSVHPVDQGVLVRAEVREGAERLRPGLFVRAQLRRATDAGEPARFRVPRSALVRSGDRTLVFVERTTGFEARPVRVLEENGEQAVVAGDLAGDARVASRGTASLKSLWLEASGGR